MKKSTAGKFAILLLPLIILGSVFFFTQNPPSIEQLIDPQTRVRAYHQLWMKTESAQEFALFKPLHSFSNFRQSQYEMKIWKIPVKGDFLKPYYLVLRDEDMFSTPKKPPWSSWKSGIGIANWINWFSKTKHIIGTPPLEEASADPITKEYVISLFSHDGKLLDERDPRPFLGEQYDPNR